MEPGKSERHPNCMYKVTAVLGFCQSVNCTLKSLVLNTEVWVLASALFSLSFTVSIWGHFTATSTTKYYGRYVVQHQVANTALENGAHDYMI